MVFYRASNNLFLIYLDEEGEVEVKHRRGGVDLRALCTITEDATLPFCDKGFKQPVLILELDENERNPICPIPFHVSTSSLANDKLKTIVNMLAPFYLVQPWFEEELQMMYWLLDWSGSLAGKPHVQAWHEKFLEFGGVPRVVFRSDSSDPRDEKPGLQDGAVWEIRYMCPYDLGKRAQHFVAPVIRPGVKVPRLACGSPFFLRDEDDVIWEGYEKNAHESTWKFRFLCSKAARIMEKAAKTPAELEELRRVGLTSTP